MAKQQIERKRAALKKAQEQLVKARQRRADVFARQRAAEERVKMPKVTATFAQREAARRTLVKATEALARASKRVGDVQERIALLEREIQHRHEPPLCDEHTCPPEELERRRKAREGEQQAKRKPKAAKPKAAKPKAAKPKAAKPVSAGEQQAAKPPATQRTPLRPALDRATDAVFGMAGGSSAKLWQYTRTAARSYGVPLDQLESAVKKRASNAPKATKPKAAKPKAAKAKTLAAELKQKIISSGASSPEVSVKTHKPTGHIEVRATGHGKHFTAREVREIASVAATMGYQPAHRADYFNWAHENLSLLSFDRGGSGGVMRAPSAPGIPAAGYGEEQTIGEQRAGLDAAILRIVRAAKEPVFLDDLLKQSLPLRGLGANRRASIRGSLARLAKAGKIELRPEAGSLAAHELGMPGPQGSILSYARAPLDAARASQKWTDAQLILARQVDEIIDAHPELRTNRPIERVAGSKHWRPGDDLLTDKQTRKLLEELRIAARVARQKGPSDFDRMDRMFQHRLLKEVRSMLSGPRAAKYRADRTMLRRGARTLPEFRDSPDATIDEAVERVERELATKATPQKREPVKSGGPTEAKAIRTTRLPVGSKYEILEDVTRSEAPVYSILSDGAEIAEVRRVNGDFKASLPKGMITPAVVERLERRAPGAGQVLAERARQVDELGGVMPSQLKRGQTYRDTRDDKLITITKVDDAQDDEPLVGANWTQGGAAYAGLVDVRHLVRVKAPKTEKTISRGKGGSFKVALRDPLGMRDVKGTRYGPVFVFDRKQIEERPIGRWGVSEIQSGKAIQSFDAKHEAVTAAKWIAEHESIFQRARGGDKTAVAQLKQGVREALDAARKKRDAPRPAARVDAPVKQAKGKAEITIQDPAGGTRKATGELHGPVAILKMGTSTKPVWSLTDVTTGARVQGYRKKADALAAARWIKQHEDLYRSVVEAMTAGRQPDASKLQALLQATAKGKI